MQIGYEFYKNFFDLWLMVQKLKNHWNTLKIYLFGQTNKKPSSNFEPWKYLKYKQL